MATALARVFQDPPHSLETLILCPKNLTDWIPAHAELRFARVVARRVLKESLMLQLGRCISCPFSCGLPFRLIAAIAYRVQPHQEERKTRQKAARSF